MNELPLLSGRLVRLVAKDPETDAEIFARWTLDSEYNRLLDSILARPSTPQATKDALEKEEVKHDSFAFSIRSLSDNQLIGVIELDEVKWSHREAWVGIGIGERDYWGKGYGTDAMRVILRYAFEELDLFRVTLNVFEYNQRALRSYLKVGFVEEGRIRQYLNRDGKRWDLIYMGILRPEWDRLPGSG